MQLRATRLKAILNEGGFVPWTPALLPNLALWLDADDPATITLNGTDVAQWDDKSGNGNHAVQSVAAAQPAYTPGGLNGKPVITFPGTDDGFILTNSVGLPRDMLSVNQGYGYLYSANTTTERLMYSTPGTNLFWSLATGSPSNTPVPGRDGTSVFIDHYTTQGFTYEVFLNGVSALSGGLGSSWTNNNAMNQIGLKWASATGIPAWTGIMAEIVWTNSVLSLTDRQLLEGYFAWKWGGI